MVDASDHLLAPARAAVASGGIATDPAFDGRLARHLPRFAAESWRSTATIRVSGTTASLAGVEGGDPGGVARVLLLHAVALSAGGIPLLTLGDEVGQLNDPGYRARPDEAGDSRWVHRPDALYAERDDPGTAAGAVFAGFRRMVAARRAAPALGGTAIHGFWAGLPAVLAFLRPDAGGLLVLANFGDAPATLPRERFGALPAGAVDLISGAAVDLGRDLALPPLAVLWLAPAGRG